MFLFAEKTFFPLHVTKPLCNERGSNFEKSNRQNVLAFFIAFFVDVCDVFICQFLHFFFQIFQNIFCDFFFLFLFFVVLWEVAAEFSWIDSFIFSSPLRIAKTAWQMLQDGSLIMHIGVTLSETLISFALVVICGILLAILLWMLPMEIGRASCRERV